MDFKKYKTFQVVADTLNLTRAADLLGYSQPTITLQLQSLESELGVALLGRSGKRTYLTPAGKLVKQYVDKTLALMEEMEAELRKLENPHGLLTVAAPEFYCTQYLSLILHSYIVENPSVKLQLFSCDSNDAMRKVSANEADLAIIAGPCDSPQMETMPLGKEDLVLVTTSELLAQHELAELLETYPFITYKSGSNIQRLVNDCLKEYGIAPDKYIECVSDETIKRTVMYHTGTALLGAALVEDELRKGTLAEIHRFPGKIETNMVILRKRAAEQNIHSFAEIVKRIWKEWD
ncbi:LysR family transcriptional regulator [Paenibacillus sacheonensis]|uniref:LysR family transcriptional regulator n=1 Tax=Paenibacillus sacheonensis TaxID=742054 RepID=A0A7X4YKW0_9BACL|nr:LysR family transcriptional regulator [Paenibacillus sacheonensis]MBM7563241.1 DNA-binding transcriptional LysR family regulator [Paenibacillus sacheonensis]NBC68200.1 LysR family transcriptional regulator [Paenibacillus sacheonensis]